LISAMRQGPTPRRVHELSTLFGVDRATVARWQAFWRDYIPQTPFWKLARGRVVPVVEIVVPPTRLTQARRIGSARRRLDRTGPGGSGPGSESFLFTASRRGEFVASSCRPGRPVLGWIPSPRPRGRRGSPLNPS
jgi:hypothetical protein